MDLVVLAIACAAGFVATWLARKLALRYNVVNHPNPIVPDHKSAIPYLGGVGILCATYFSMLVYRLVMGNGALLDAHRGAFRPSMMAGGLLFLAVGLLDDLRTFRPGFKTILHLLALGIAMSFGGLTRTVSGNVIFDTFFSGLWILAMVNAFNFMDVCDGLAGSVAVVTFGLFAMTSTSSYPVLAIALAGSCLGFVYWNRPPAKIFMGDAGSNFLGFMLGAFTLTETSGTTWWPYIAMMTLFAGVPFFDLLFQSGVRIAQGRSVLLGGPDSFALRMQKAGLKKNQVDLIAVLVASGFWYSAWILPQLHPIGQIAVVILDNVFIVTAWRWLLRWEVRTDA